MAAPAAPVVAAVLIAHPLKTKTAHETNSRASLSTPAFLCANRFLGAHRRQRWPARRGGLRGLFLSSSSALSFSRRPVSRSAVEVSGSASWSATGLGAGFFAVRMAGSAAIVPQPTCLPIPCRHTVCAYSANMTRRARSTTLTSPPRGLDILRHAEPPRQPCWHCHWFDGMAGKDTAYCSNPRCSRVRSTASTGCCLWEREPGADDR